MSIRRMLAWLAYAICASLLSVAALEFAVRVSGQVDHLYTEPAFESSPRGDYWRYRPGFAGQLLGPTQARIGPLGSRLHGLPHSGSDLRVAIFGDSIAFGQGVDERLTMSAQLETALRRAGFSVEVLNFGVQGHALEMEVAHLADRLAEMHPAAVVFAFAVDDLSPLRVDNYVDRFGYLTKRTFGPPSYWGDWLRALLRRSYLALLMKSVLLKMREPEQSFGTAPPAGASPNWEAELARLRSAMDRFRELTVGMGRVVICVSEAETSLARAVRATMAADFPDLPYAHAPAVLGRLPREQLRVPRDEHPNATAHEIYAELLEPAVAAALRSQVQSP